MDMFLCHFLYYVDGAVTNIYASMLGANVDMAAHPKVPENNNQWYTAVIVCPSFLPSREYLREGAKWSIMQRLLQNLLRIMFA